MIKIQPFDSDECKKFTKFSKKYYNQENVTDYTFVNWKFIKYDKNLINWHLTFMNDSSIVGRAALCERELNFCGNKTKITQVSDLLVDPQKKNNAFLSLIKSFNKLKNECVLHTSNENSYLLYKKIFKFDEKVILTPVVFPIKPQSFVENSALKFILTLFSKFFISMHDLVFSQYKFSKIKEYKDVSHPDIHKFLLKYSQCNLNFDRSLDFLRWRTTSNQLDCKIFGLNKDNSLSTLIILSKGKFHALNYLLILDFLVLRKVNKRDFIYIKFFIIKLAIKNKVDAIFGLFNFNCKSVKKIGKLPFFKISDHLLPHSTPIFFSSLSEQIEVIPLEKMYISLLDLDYF
jgi:hypothetical protein